MDLMSNIQLLINDKLVRIIKFFSFLKLFLFCFKSLVEQTYRERIAELQDQNERKDLRIKLLEQKLQKLQVCYYYNIQ